MKLLIKYSSFLLFQGIPHRELIISGRLVVIAPNYLSSQCMLSLKNGVNISLFVLYHKYGSTQLSLHLKFILRGSHFKNITIH